MSGHEKPDFLIGRAAARFGQDHKNYRLWLILVENRP
jgi:hypothetical protein